MGYAIPAAIGAHFACNTAPLIAIAGDGGFQMSLPELSTIAEFDIPVKIVVMNNRMLGLMKNFQDENFNGVHPATVDGYATPDFCKLADVYGLPNKTISSDDEVEEAIQWLSSQPGKALLEVKVPQDWGPYPKVLPGKGLSQQRPALDATIESKIEEVFK